MFQSVGVIIAAVAIKIWPKAQIIDPICTFLFCFIVLLTTIPIIIDCVKILMESSPSTSKTEKIQKALEDIECVTEVHDLHLWSLNTSNQTLTVHIKSTDPMWSLKRATRMLNTKFKILHTTIQVEDDIEEKDIDSNSEKAYKCNLYH